MDFNISVSWPEGNTDSRREMTADELRAFMDEVIDSAADHSIWSVPVIIEICQH